MYATSDRRRDRTFQLEISSSVTFLYISVILLKLSVIFCIGYGGNSPGVRPAPRRFTPRPAGPGSGLRSAGARRRRRGPSPRRADRALTLRAPGQWAPDPIAAPRARGAAAGGSLTTTKQLPGILFRSVGHPSRARSLVPRAASWYMISISIEVERLNPV